MECWNSSSLACSPLHYSITPSLHSSYHETESVDPDHRRSVGGDFRAAAVHVPGTPVGSRRGDHFWSAHEHHYRAAFLPVFQMALADPERLQARPAHPELRGQAGRTHHRG